MAFGKFDSVMDDAPQPAPAALVLRPSLVCGEPFLGRHDPPGQISVLFCLAKG
jgi:hypothetical protein